MTEKLRERIENILEDRVFLLDTDSVPVEGEFLDAEAIPQIVGKIFQALKEPEVIDGVTYELRLVPKELSVEFWINFFEQLRGGNTILSLQFEGELAKSCNQAINSQIKEL